MRSNQQTLGFGGNRTTFMRFFRIEPHIWINNYNILQLLGSALGLIHGDLPAIAPSRNSPLYLVGGIPTPLKNMSSSVGMMTFQRYGDS